MRQGHLLRHLRGMRRVYAARRKALIDAIAALMPNDLTVSSAVTGLHLVALFTDAMRRRMSDREAAGVLKQAGIHVQPLSQNFSDAPGHGVRLQALARGGRTATARENRSLHQQRLPRRIIRSGVVPDRARAIKRG
jgi:DNA-binding transcriptional MocR family regulator